MRIGFVLATLVLCALPGCESVEDDANEAPVVVAPESAVLDGLPFSPGIQAGDFLFLSGAIGNTPGTLELVSDDPAEQTTRAMENLRRVLRAGGADLDDVVKCTVFLADMADYDAMNEAYAGVWPGPPPARSTVAGSGLALGARVEIECVAYVGDTG